MERKTKRSGRRLDWYCDYHTSMRNGVPRTHTSVIPAVGKAKAEESLELTGHKEIKGKDTASRD